MQPPHLQRTQARRRPATDRRRSEKCSQLTCIPHSISAWLAVLLLERHMSQRAVTYRNICSMYICAQAGHSVPRQVLREQGDAPRDMSSSLVECKRKVPITIVAKPQASVTICVPVWGSCTCNNHHHLDTTYGNAAQ